MSETNLSENYIIQTRRGMLWQLSVADGAVVFSQLHKAPNWFLRWLQGWLLGFKWSRM